MRYLFLSFLLLTACSKEKPVTPATVAPTSASVTRTETPAEVTPIIGEVLWAQRNMANMSAKQLYDVVQRYSADSGNSVAELGTERLRAALLGTGPDVVMRGEQPQRYLSQWPGGEVTISVAGTDHHLRVSVKIGKYQALQE